MRSVGSCHRAFFTQGLAHIGPAVPKVAERSIMGASGLQKQYILQSLTGPALCMSQVPKLVDRYMAGETMLDQYISHEMAFDQVPRPRPCPCWMVSLHLHAMLLTACSAAVLQRPTCRLQTVASTSVTHIPCLNFFCHLQINKAFDLLHAGALCNQLPARNARHGCYSISHDIWLMTQSK